MISSSFPSTPNVLIIIATDVMSGPGKGLLQFLAYRPELSFAYTLCNFDATWMRYGSDEFLQKAKKSGIKIEYIKQNLPIDPIMVARVINITKRCHNNIVQTHGYKPNLIGFFLKMIQRIPWIAFAHGYTDDSRKLRAYNLIDQLLLRHANIVVAVSKATKRFLIGKGINPSRIVVIRNAIGYAEVVPQKSKKDIKTSLGIKNDEVVIGTVGRLGPEKGQIVFLKAFKNVLRHFPHVKAIIIGDGQERNSLKRYCEENNISRNVVFTGYVNNVADYYQIMDILVIPSLSEGLPNVLLEAMSFGVAVIATAVGGIPEVVKANSGILVPPGNRKKLGEEILGLLASREHLDRLKINARKSILSTLDPQERAGRIVDLYHHVLKRV